MLEHTRQKDTLYVKLKGELDHFSAQQIREELDALIADERVHRLVLDLEGLTFMDSSGVGVLIGRYRALLRRKGVVALKNVHPQVDKILYLSGIYQVIEKLA